MELKNIKSKLEFLEEKGEELEPNELVDLVNELEVDLRDFEEFSPEGMMPNRFYNKFSFAFTELEI